MVSSSQRLLASTSTTHGHSSFDIQQFSSQRPLSLLEAVAAVLQWDTVFAILGSTFLVTFWFAQSAKDILLLFLLWHVVISIAFGPGAAITGVLLVREARLNARAVGGNKEQSYEGIDLGWSTK